MQRLVDQQPNEFELHMRLPASAFPVREPGEAEAHLQQRICSVLKFAEWNLGRLQQHAKFWSDEDELVRREDKLVTETVMLLLVTDRVGAREYDKCWENLARYCIEWSRSKRTRCVIARHPRTVSILGIGHLLLTSLGYPDHSMDQLVENAIGTGQVGAQELVPFRNLEQRWIEKQLTFAPQVSLTTADWEKSTSAITSDFPGIYVTREDCYALTHTMIYLSDFGWSEIKGIDSRILRKRLSGAISFALAVGDFDILGELLLSDAALPGGASSAAHCGWAVRKKTLEDRGYLPGPGFRIDEYRDLSEAGQEAYAFWHKYHVAYVDALLCASLLARSSSWLSSQPVYVDQDCDVQKTMDIAWPDLTAEAASIAATLHACPVAPAQLWETLTEMAAITVIRRYDLLALWNLLKELNRSSLKPSSAVNMAGQFLSNQLQLKSDL
ncbi:DUF6895 family protein [Streptomyces sp. NPDC002962]|uniref:DUF6895 family protein n=1 Tax=Streptomyces sp. NPDC002962 TaxID=3364674 RepID=UPI003698C032